MNFASFDLNLLRVFDALIRERSVTRAGELIGLSQPAVSNALSRLRHHFADELFVRRGHDMVPTPKAEELAQTIQKALADIEGAVTEDGPFQPEHLDQVFTFSGADFFSTLFLPRLFSRVAPTAPGVILRMIESATVGVELLLRDSAIDFALERDLGAQPDWVSSAALMQSPFCVVAARGNPLLKDRGLRPGEALPLDLFCAMPHALRTSDGSLHGIIDEGLAQVGQARRVALALPHFHAVAVAVASCDLIATLPEQSARDAAQMVDIDIFAPPVDIAPQKLRLYWHRRHDRSPAHRWMRDQIMQTARELDP